MNNKYVQIIVDSKALDTDKPYTYTIGPDIDECIEAGMRVLVPFGRGNRIVKGIVIGFEKGQEEYLYKEIIDVIDDKPLIPKELIELGLWMKQKYLATYINALQAVLPPGDFKEVKTNISLVNNDPEIDHSLSSLDKEIVNIVNKHNGQMELEQLKALVKGRNANRIIRELEKRDIIKTSLDIQTTIKEKYEKYAVIKNDSMKHGQMMEVIGKRSYKQLEVAKYLLNSSEITLQELMTKTNSSLSTIRSLEQKGIIKIFQKVVYRTPIGNDIERYGKHQLSADQQYCIDTILSSVKDSTKNKKFLIHGVTGSGKTEIYLQLVEEMIRLGKDSIVLVPEIALTPQTIGRFVGRFGDNVAVLHSKLSLGERFDQWRRIREGKARIVIGARSAVFAPFSNLGLIVIDEEHEDTYKSSMNPKYNTIEIAEMRCKNANALLVSGSATPSIETYFKSSINEIELLNLKQRINERELPLIRIIDMRQELNIGNRSIFSRELHEAISENLRIGKQTILFLNRRGYSTFVSCRQCGYVVKCKECSISMTYHLRENKLKCHYCGLAVSPPKVCPVCKSKYIKYFGIGTEKVEKHTKEIFPNAVVKRMDMDTTSRKGSHECIFNEMKNGEIDILIGTQMVAKGLDFKGVTLVGIIAADTTLNLPDFRSSERTFQLITQVAGRAGRGEFEGKVIVQTYSPSHYSIQYAKSHNFIEFYNKEILIRKEFNYPPFTNLISIVVYGRNNERTYKAIKAIHYTLLNNINKNDLTDMKKNMVGPFPAPLEKIRNNYRYQIIIKAKDEQLEEVKDCIERVCIHNIGGVDLIGVKISIDINPNSIL